MKDAKAREAAKKAAAAQRAKDAKAREAAKKAAAAAKAREAKAREAARKAAAAQKLREAKLRQKEREAAAKQRAKEKAAAAAAKAAEREAALARKEAEKKAAADAKAAQLAKEAAERAAIMPVPIANATLEIPKALKQPHSIVKPKPHVREDETPWTAKELKEQRSELEAELARLQAELAEMEGAFNELVKNEDFAGDDAADQGSNTLEREQEMSLNANLRDLMDQTTRALQRLGDGSYGKCESCGNPIGKLRLQAKPAATLCITCKEKEDLG